MREKILLLDGNSLLNRAFYAVPALTSGDGEHTNAVYGFLNIFFKLYETEKPDYITAAFDEHAKTFRHLKYDGYKAARGPMPAELVPQVALIRNLLVKMGVAVASKEGFEADDVLGTLAKKAQAAGLSAVIASSDRDLLQLADDFIKVSLTRTKSGKTETENFFKDDFTRKYGVSPDEYVLVKALCGDASDNIPGAPGIGEATALKIVSRFKSLDAIFKNAENLPKKSAKSVLNNAEAIKLSYELSKIDINAPVALEVKTRVTMAAMQNAEAKAEILRLNIKSLYARFNIGPNGQTRETHYEQASFF